MVSVSVARGIVLVFFFVSGAFTAVLGNIMYNTQSIGKHNIVKPFQKPWFQGWSMFLAMSVLIFDTPFSQACRCPTYKPGGPVRGIALLRTVAIPAMCDMFATVLQNIALLFLPPSVWQMTRGSILLFTALFSIFYRHHKLHIPDWLGVITTIGGITLVGVAAIVTDKTPKSSPGKMIMSMCLIVIAQGLQAFQTIIEEELLHDVDATENEIVSFEGLWGLFFSSFIMMPIAMIMPPNAGEGIYEDSIESFIMISNSYAIFFLVVGYMAAILIYNLTGMMVTSFSSAILRNIYEALRSAAVWLLSVIVYYISPSSGGGEKLTWPGSLLQLLGFCISILGSFIYNRVIKFPCCKEPEEEGQEEKQETIPPEVNEELINNEQNE